jgi:peptide/nickel transport system substrate-binding protein
MRRSARGRARIAVALIATLAIASCSSADAPDEAATDTASAPGSDTASDAPGSTTPDEGTSAPAPDDSSTASSTAGSATAPSDGLQPDGVPEGVDTIETPAPTGPVDSAVFAVYRETATIDPLYVFDYPDNSAMSIACEALLRMQPDLTSGPGLATSVEYTSPTSLVITLRDDVTFWDGTPMTADDVVYSLQRQQDPANGGFYGAVMSNVTAIEATAPNVVTVTTTAQDMLLLGELAGPVGTVIEKAFAESLDPGVFGTAAGGAMCTGPYQIDSWVVGEGVTFTRYDGYWDTSLPLQLQSVTIKGVPDEAALTSGLLTGEIDGTYPLIMSTLDQLKASDKLNVTEGPSMAISAFIVSSFEGPLGDQRVRQALSMALDRQGLVDALHKGAGYPARAVATPGTWGYSRDTFVAGWNALPDTSTPNLEAAKQLVIDAGVEGQTVKIGMSSELPPVLVEAGELQRALESIGLQAELVPKSAADYIQFFIDPAAFTSVDGFFTVNYPDFADPLAIYATMIGPNGSQAFNGYADPAAQDLLERARIEADDDARAALVVELQALITDQMLWIPMVAPTQPLVLNKRLTGAPSTFAYMFGPWAAYLGAA